MKTWKLNLISLGCPIGQILGLGTTCKDTEPPQVRDINWNSIKHCVKTNS